MLKAGVGIVTAAMLGDELLVVSRLRELVGTQEQHVLEKMCQALATGRIVSTAYQHIKRRGGLGSFRIGNEQHFELVGQGEVTVPVVVIGALDRLRLPSRQAGTGGQQREHRKEGQCAAPLSKAECLHDLLQTALIITLCGRGPGVDYRLDQGCQGNGKKHTPETPDAAEKQHRQDNGDRVQIDCLGE